MIIKRFLALLAGLVMISLPSHLLAQTFVVSPGGIGESGLQGAVTTAVPGDNIVLTSGVYYPTSGMIISSSGTDANPLTISGDGGEVVIDASLTGNAVNAVFSLIGASNVTLRNLTITGRFDGTGIYIEDSNNCTVDNVSISRMNVHSILLHGATNCTVKNSYMTRAWEVSLVCRTNSSGGGGTGNLLENNLLERNGESDILVSGSNNTVRGNECRNSGDTYPYDHGIYVLGDSHTIADNYIHDQAYGSGIRSGGTNHMISGNACVYNASVGILIAGTNESHDVAIVDNTCTGNGLAGIQINSSDYNSYNIVMFNNLLNLNRDNVYIQAGTHSLAFVNNHMSENGRYSMVFETDPTIAVWHENFFYGGNCLFRTSAGIFDAPTFGNQVGQSFTCNPDVYSPPAE